MFVWLLLLATTLPLSGRDAERQRRAEARGDLFRTIDLYEGHCPRARHYAIHLRNWANDYPLRSAPTYEHVAAWYFADVVQTCESRPTPLQCVRAPESQFLGLLCLYDYHADHDHEDLYCFSHPQFTECRGLTASECSGRLVAPHGAGSSSRFRYQTKPSAKHSATP